VSTRLLTVLTFARTENFSLYTRVFLLYSLALSKGCLVKNGKVKPILIMPPPELRQRIEQEAKKQSRSMNNLLILILTKVFHQQDVNARAGE
jgi:hypothetical protein